MRNESRERMGHYHKRNKLPLKRNKVKILIKRTKTSLKLQRDQQSSERTTANVPFHRLVFRIVPIDIREERAQYH